ncbi:MAG: hypothetical protein Q6355_10845, partial [Candidatus Brocadiales bacterium]|nr:hypothetical protein [Candidatus Brocadiales bacterium]
MKHRIKIISFTVTLALVMQGLFISLNAAERSTKTIGTVKKTLLDLAIQYARTGLVDTAIPELKKIIE